MSSKVKISIGISPCPNDTYIFYALIKNKIHSDFDFEFVMADVEELNHLAFANKLEVCKLSINAFGHLTQKYQLLDAGSALGKNCGPLLIKKAGSNIVEPKDYKIAIPGEFTTANLLLTMAFPLAQNKELMLFSDIEEAVLKGKSDLGLIIHESRFTYKDRGLALVKDLGNFWEDKMQAPLPLGGIACKRKLDENIKKELSALIRKSIDYAEDNLEETLDFCKDYAQEMDKKVMLQHINLYVNEYSKALDIQAKSAIFSLLQHTAQLQKVVLDNSELFAPTYEV